MKMHQYLLFVLLAIAGCSGCNGTSKQDATVPVGDSLSKTEVYISTAQGAVAKAVPHTDAEGKIHLGTAGDALGGAAKENQTAQKELVEVRKQSGAQKETIAKQEQQIDAYHHRWIGDETIKWFKIIIASTIAAWLISGIGGMLLKTYGGGWLASIGGNVIGALPVANPFIWVGKFLAARKAVSPVPAPVI